MAQLYSQTRPRTDSQEGRTGFESKKINENLAQRLLELLEKGSIMGLNNMRIKLQAFTNNEITRERMKSILRILRGKIEVTDRGKGKETIYSLKR